MCAWQYCQWQVPQLPRLKITGQSHPCLPPHLLQEFKSDPDPTLPYETSWCAWPGLDGMRDALLKQGVDARWQAFFQTDITNHPLIPPDSLTAKEYATGSGQTLLHHAASFWDLPLAYECVRLGANINAQNTSGLTPLMAAVRSVASARIMELEGAQAGRNTDGAVSRKNRALRIMNMLLEQHADVNLGEWCGMSCLGLAWATLDWSTMALLLRYGARMADNILEPWPPFLPSFRGDEDLRRFFQMVASAGPAFRPPRPCPCWSGKLLSECHGAASQPFPPEFLCPCGSFKVFRVCCNRRDFQTTEIWDEERQRIMIISHHLDSRVFIKRGVRENIALYLDASGRQAPASEQEQDSSHQFFLALGDALTAKGLIDPAFFHAVKKTGLLPYSWGKHYSKLECQGRADLWNATVDEYIALGTDSRPRLDIELTSKIGLDGGPLFKRCEMTGCAASESTGIKMKRCKGCERIYYCSKDCQTANWSTHKAACRSRNHHFQILPSQRIYEHYLHVYMSQ